MIHAMIQYKIQKNQKANSRYDSHFGNNGLNDEFVIKKLIKIIIVKEELDFRGQKSNNKQSPLNSKCTIKKK